MPAPGPDRTKWLTSRGLAHLDGCSYPMRRAMGGPNPGGHGGLVLAAIPEGKDLDRAFEIGYHPQHAGQPPRQETWIEAANGAHWIGYADDWKPVPQDLARANQIKGHAVRLNDGHDWIFPAVRLAGGGSGLPQSIGLDHHGDLILEDLPQYADVQEGAQLCYDRFNEGVGFTYREILKVLSRILGLNYRISAAESTLLRLFDTENILRAMWAIVDGPVLDKIYRDAEEAKKKDESTITEDSQSTASIIEADFQAIDQLSQTCGSSPGDGMNSHG